MYLHVVRLLSRTRLDQVSVDFLSDGSGLIRDRLHTYVHVVWLELGRHACLMQCNSAKCNHIS